MSLTYANLTWEQAIEKLKEIESNADLTIQQKIDEFGKIAYGQVYDMIGASYRLVLQDEIICQPVNYNILKYRIQTYSILYTPSDDNLPRVVLSYDHGNLIDLID